MFVRKKKNKSGTISVVVIDKSHGGFKEVKNFGVVSSEAEADALCVHAHEWIRAYGGQLQIDFGKPPVFERELEETDRAFANIDAVFMNAPQLRPHSRRDTQTSCHSQDMSANEQDGHGGLP